MIGIARRALLAGALGLTALLTASCTPPAQDENTIVFGILPAEGQGASERIWGPLIEDLERETGLNVEPRFVTNYRLLVEAMRADQVQVGWFSALPALQAVEEADAQVIGRIADLEGNTGYQSVLIVQRGSGITLDDVLACDRSLTFGMGDALSTSGTLAPMAFLFGPRNIEPAECFSQVRNASHETNAVAVASGTVDVATNNSVGMVFFGRNQPRQAERLEVIWESPPIPESSIIVRRNVDPAAVERIRSFFLTYGQGEGERADAQRAILQELRYGAFLAADDSYLDPVREMRAAEALRQARRSGDQARIAEAQAAYDAIHARVAAAQEVQP